MTRGALLIAVVVLLAMSAPSKRLEILRYTSVAWEDEEVLIVVRVDPQPANRWLTVYASDDGEVVRQSRIQLDGEQAMRTHWIRYRLPAGELIITVALSDSQRVIARASAPMRVLSRL